MSFHVDLPVKRQTFCFFEVFIAVLQFTSFLPRGGVAFVAVSKRDKTTPGIHRPLQTPSSLHYLSHFASFFTLSYYFSLSLRYSFILFLFFVRKPRHSFSFVHPQAFSILCFAENRMILAILFVRLDLLLLIGFPDVGFSYPIPVF